MRDLIQKAKRVERGTNEAGDAFFLSLVYPVVSPEAAGAERLNSFYQAMNDRIAETAARHGCTAITELHRITADECGYSLYMDLWYYRGRQVLACRRIADAREWDGSVRMPPRVLKRLLHRYHGWYDDGSRYCLFRNEALPDDREGLSRADYRKAISVTVIPYSTAPKNEPAP